MIPILYDHAEKDFTSQGICRLADAVDCFVTEERNGIYECELKYPIDGLYFEEIFEGRLIGATHDDNGDIQPFEIYKHSAPIDGIVTFYAHHLSYRLRNHILIPFHASSCTEAMSVLKAKSMNNCPFNFFTDVGTLGNFDVEYPVSIKARLAGDGDSILNLYGPGEFKYDKWNVSFLEHRGVDHGVEIRYGKNLTDITREYDESEVYTAVVPYWFKEDSEGNKTLVTLDEYGVIVSESDAVQHVFWTNENDEIIRDEQGHPIEFSSENMIYAPLDLTSEFDEAPTQAQLATRAKQLFEAAQPWLPEDNIKISFVALWQTPEYEDYAPLEKVSLCDIVHVIHTRIGVMVDAEVIKTVYNVLLDRYNAIELGSPQTSYADEIASDTQAALEEIQRQIRRSVTADYVNEQISSATDKITGGLGGYVKVTLNANGEPQEILVMDKPSTETAVKVIRINQNGIGFSTTGYQGPFNSAWLIDGTFDAQVINVINLAATVIRTGFLTDAKGYNYWNLETGEFRLSSTAMLDTYKEYSYVATRDYAVGDKIEIQTDQDTLIYEVTTTIPKDATIQPGVNVKAATAHTLLDFARKAETVINVDIEYASHTSSITPPPEDSPLWQTESPAWELGKYIWQRTKMTDGNGADNYSNPVCIQGAQGTNTAIIYLYKRSASAATIDWTNQLTYSFATNALMSLPTGWYDSIDDIPASNDPIYMTAATASSKDSTDVIPYHEWATPIKMSQNGADAPKTAFVTLYKRSSSSNPVGPSGVLTYQFSDASLTPSANLNGWSREIPASDGNPCYSIQAVAIGTGSSVSIAANNWSSPPLQILSDGINGHNSKIVYLYKRDSSVPSKPTGTFNYTFSTDTLSPMPSGWSRNYVGDNQTPARPLYVIAVTVNVSADTDAVEFNGSSWSEPVILVQDGTPGVKGESSVVVNLYKRSTTTISAIDWNRNLKYDFSTNALVSTGGSQPAEPTGWTQAVPDTSTDGDLYVTAATVSSTETQVEIPANAWATPVCITKNGLSWSSAAVFLYARAATSTDLVKPTQDLTYTFSTGILSRGGQSGPTVLGQWSQSIPASGSNHYPCFVIQATAVSSDGQTDTIASGEWQGPFILVSDGEDGLNCATVSLYARAASASDLTSLKPNVALEYNFSDGKLYYNDSIWTSQTWSQQIPDSDAQRNPCFVIQATASNTATIDEIAANSWSNPTKVVVDGQDGKSISSITEYYARSESNSVAPSSWSTTVPTLTDVYKYLWNYEVISYSDSTTDESAKRVIGVYGNTGKGISSIVEYYATNNSTTAPSKSSFSTSIVTPTADNPFLWNYEVTTYTDTTTSETDRHIIGRYGKDGEAGKGISSIVEYYARSSSNTIAPTSWSETVPALTNTYKYLWNYEVTTYTDNTTHETAKRVIGVRGNNGSAGKGISSIANHYLATSLGSGVTKQTTGWTTDPTEAVMTVTDKYLWAYETITYTDETTSETDPTIIGVYGESGKGINEIEEQYALGSSTSTAPASGWSATQPAWERGSYIWTRSKITWSDSSITYTTPVCASAINGANEAVVNLDDSLTQNEVFKRLTNGFNTEGIFLENGRLFVNSTGIATGFIHDKATVGGTNVTFYNEQNNIASRDYAIGDYITYDSYACQAKKAIYAYEWINNSSAYTTNVTRLGTVYGESSNVATRDYAVNDYIVFGGNLYQATVAISTGTTISSSGFKNCNLLGPCYIQTSYYATRSYSSGDYIKSISNLYQATTSIASGDMVFPGANVNYLNLGSMYHNYWNLNTGQFVTARGLIAGFNIGESTYNGSSWSSLFYMSAKRDEVYNWGYPYSAANTPVQGVGLRGSSDSVNLGFNIISQGRMYVNNANTNYAGRIRMSAGMLYFDLGLSPTSVNSSWTTAAYINPWSGTGGTGININGNLAVTGNLACTGSKPRIVDTDDYGWRYLYAYENPTPMFGDIGEGEIGVDGLCHVWLEPIFAQTIENSQYQVFLQKYGDGKCFIKTRASGYFIVQGTPGLTFGWEIKAKQKGYGMTRLQNEAKNFGIIQPAMPENQDNFANASNDYLQNLREGREST